MAWEIVKKSIQGTLPTYREFIADYVEDLDDLPTCASGSTCYVSGTGDTYIREADGDWVIKSSSGGGGGVSNFADLEDVEFPADPDVGTLFVGYDDAFSFVPMSFIGSGLTRPTVNIFKDNGEWTSNLEDIDNLEQFWSAEFNGIVTLDISTENVTNVETVTNFASSLQDGDLMVSYTVPYMNNNNEYIVTFVVLIDTVSGGVEVLRFHDIDVYTELI